MTTLTAEKLQLTVFELAHQNNMTVDAFMTHIVGQYEVDNSDLPRNEKNEIVYENGDIGIDLDMKDEELLTIHWAAAHGGMTTNQFVVAALEEALEKLKSEKKI